jgi:hypothetical protein
MKKITFLLTIAVLLSTKYKTNAQVNGISYTFAPTAEFQKLSDKQGISDGYFVGGKVGFGFGQFVELKANYMQSLNLKRDFSKLENLGFDAANLKDQSVDITRWGGELKINLSNKALVPYLSVGTGVQTTSTDSSNSFKNIYFTGGGGIQFSAGDRYTIALGVNNNYINTSPVANLLNTSERRNNGLAAADFPPSRLTNLSYNASLILYLGGKRTSEFTDVDKAYLETFSNGFNGISLPLEISTGQINFAKDLGLENTKFIGVSSGFNFGQYVGIRGFYWRANEDKYFSPVQRLAIYGIEGKFKLASNNGLSPYLNVGGGKIDALTGFQAPTASTFKDSPFVSGGIGLDLPFSKYFKLSAFAKAMLTSNNLLENSQKPEDLSTSWAYGLTANLVIGKKSRNLDKTLSSSYDERIEEALNVEKKKTEVLKSEYELKIENLEEEMKAAIDKGDKDEFIEKSTEKKAVEKAVEKLDDVLVKENKANNYPQNGQVASWGLTPTEFRSSISNIKMTMESEMQSLKNTIENNQMKTSMEIQELNFKIESINNALRSIESNQKDDVFEIKSQLNRDLLDIKNKLNLIDQKTSSTTTIIKTEDGTLQAVAQAPTVINQSRAANTAYLTDDQLNAVAERNQNTGFFSKLNYSGASAFGGFNLGGNPTANLGMRWHYQYQKSSFYVVPETFFGFGNPASFGLFLNGVKEFNIKKANSFTPYIGLGGGFLKIGEKGEDVIKLTSNIVIGANLFKVAGGKFYVDISGRGLFKHNQFVAGYRLPF